jgi:two-component system phosphate regulon response regulator PhoB
VLVVEDEPDYASLLSYQMRRRGLAVDVVPSGLQVMRFASQAVYKLFVLDVLTPGMMGLELCQLLRENWRTRGSRILVTSALGETLPKARVLEAGADDYLPKPQPLLGLIEKMETMLRDTGLGTPSLCYPRFGLELNTGRLLVGTRSLILSTREVHVMRLLNLLPAGEWCPLDRLLSAAWTLGLQFSGREMESLLEGLKVKFSDPHDSVPFLELTQVKGLRWNPN